MKRSFASSRQPSQAPFRRRLDPTLVAALCCCAAGGAAQPLPSGLGVVQGAATMATRGQQMTVTNADNSILRWQSFSIAPGHSVTFVQPSAGSRVLNRVSGTDPSQIFGRLSSNGSVWLLNPNGILFGRDSRVDVAQLVASTLDISDADWQARRYRLFAVPTAAAGATVRNEGTLMSTTGGRISLLGGSAGVVNTGSISAPSGQVAIAAAQAIELVDSTSPDIAVRISLPGGSVTNLGELLSENGRIDLQAALVRQQGVARADAARGGIGGEVTIAATQALDIAAGSSTSANGGAGGRVTLAGATNLIEGTVSATGSSHAGGTIRLLGEHVGLLGNALIDASGWRGGGSIFAGGGRAGQDPALPNARALFMGKGASVAADAIDRGSGGTIVLWSDRATRVYGTLSARGGRAGGDGGFIETSGGWLDARPAAVRADARAPSGKAGQWLLDPADLTIQGGSFEDVTGTDDGGTATFASDQTSSVLLASTVERALNDRGLNVTIRTGPAGDGEGNITLATGTTITYTAAQARTLTLEAHGSINLQSESSIDAQGLPLDVVMNAGLGKTGGIFIRGDGIDKLGASIRTAGNIALSANQIFLSPMALPGSAPASRPALTGSQVSLRGDTIVFMNPLPLSSPSIRAAAAGDAIVIAGKNGGGVTQLFSSAGPPPLETPNGRWLIYTKDLDPANVILGSLDGGLAFKQHAAVFGSAVPAAPGNGLLTELTPTLQLQSSLTTLTKTYDGTTAAAIDPALLQMSPLLSGDTLSGSPDKTVAFATRNAGVAIPILWTPAGVPGVVDAGGRPVFGYTIDPATNVQGIISQATLTYRADPAVAIQGAALPRLTGTVTGFVNDETDETATSGTLAFVTPAGPLAPAGKYPVVGVGLEAANYTLVQAPENATALTMVGNPAPRPPIRPALPATRVEPGTTPLPRTADIFDLPSVVTHPAQLFGDADWSLMANPNDGLRARSRYAQANHAPAMRALEANPRLAEVPYCTRVEDAIAGVCLITDALKPEFVRRCPDPGRVCSLGSPPAWSVPPTRLVLAALPLLTGAGAPIGGGMLHLAAADPLPQAAAPAGAKRYVLAIGIGEYEDPRMHGHRAPLRSLPARADAAYFRDMLVFHMGHTKIDVGAATTKAQIIEAFNRLAAHAKAEDSAVIYYAGYSLRDDLHDACHWSASDTRHDDARSWISNRSVGEYLRQVAARQVILLVDSCFSDAIAREDIAEVGSDASANRRRAAVAMISGTNAPLVDRQAGERSLFASKIIDLTKRLENPTAGLAVFDTLRKIYEQRFVREKRVFEQNYRGSKRAGHEAGADYFFPAASP